MSGIENFRKMLKAGVPRGAVEMRCQQAGFDPAMLDEQQVRTRSLTSFLKFILISYINNNTIKRKKDYQYRLHIHGMIYIVWRSACVHCYSQHPREVLKLTTFTLLTCLPQKNFTFQHINSKRESRRSSPLPDRRATSQRTLLYSFFFLHKLLCSTAVAQLYPGDWPQFSQAATVKSYTTTKM